ncbi:MAG: hypothetical protein R3E66_21590 [bacterium]
MRWIVLLVAVFVASCATEETPSGNDGQRVILPLIVSFDQSVAVSSSVFEFELPGTERIVARTAEVVFSGADGTGVPVEVTYVVECDRRGDQGNLLVKTNVDQLWSRLQPSPNAVFSGQIALSLVDEIGVWQAHSTIKPSSSKASFPAGRTG